MASKTVLPKKFKKKPRSIETANDLDLEGNSKEYLRKSNGTLRGHFTYRELKYERPVLIPIRFEEADHQRAIKVMNKDQCTFTAIVNIALKKYLDEKEKVPNSTPGNFID